MADMAVQVCVGIRGLEIIVFRKDTFPHLLHNHIIWADKLQIKIKKNFQITQEKSLLKSIENNRKDGLCIKQMETILQQLKVARQAYHAKVLLETMCTKC